MISTLLLFIFNYEKQMKVPNEFSREKSVRPINIISPSFPLEKSLTEPKCYFADVIYHNIDYQYALLF